MANSDDSKLLEITLHLAAILDGLVDYIRTDPQFDRSRFNSTFQKRLEERGKRLAEIAKDQHRRREMDKFLEDIVAEIDENTKKH